MFEILLNTAKFALSEEVKDQAGAIFSALTKASEWKNHVVTLEAKLSRDYRERADLVRDVIKDKLTDLNYSNEAIAAFSVCFGELASNAFTHGLLRAQDSFIRIVCDVSPTYVSIAAFNPAECIVDLPNWISKGVIHLVETEKKQRGRGLLTVFRKSDVLEPFGKFGVKAVVYRNRVEIVNVSPPQSMLEMNVMLPAFLIVTRGHSNPSFGRRIVERLKTFTDRPVVLVLDPAELYPLPENPKVRAALREALKLVGIELPEATRRQPKPLRYSDHETSRVSVILEYTEKFFSPRDQIRIVCNNEDFADLMPSDLIAESVDSAFKLIVKGKSSDLSIPMNSPNSTDDPQSAK